MPHFLLNIAVVSFMLCCLLGCTSNKYDDYFSVVTNSGYEKTQDPPILIELASKQQLNDFLHNDDYILIGTSDFYHLWVPRVFAIDCAKKRGASLVVLSYKKGETIKDSTVIIAPTSGTGFHTGTVYGPTGNSFNYYGQSTVFGTEPVSINYQNTYYYQNAYFFARRKNKNSFGVYFEKPERIPGKESNRVRISSVAKHSQAEKAGLKVGDYVTSINGIPIKSYDDIEIFILNKQEIHTMEVSHE